LSGHVKIVQSWLDKMTWSAHIIAMQKRSSMRKGMNRLAAEIVASFEAGQIPKTADGKNPFAVALGRRGGLKGGKARAASLSDEERSAIARRAAKTRWMKKRD